MFVCVFALALKRQWVAGGDVVQAWHAGEQRKELTKNSDAENLVILIVSIVTKWLRFTWGKMKGLSWQKIDWSDKQGTEWVRLPESGGICYYRTQKESAGRIRLFSVSLWFSASYYSIDTPLQFLPFLVVYMFLRRARLIWCSDPKETSLLSLTWLISIIFQLASTWLLSHTLGSGQGFFSTGKKKPHPYHRVCIVPGYVLDMFTGETEGITVTSLNRFRERQWCIVLLEVVGS